ncbi:ribosomal protein S30-domain-containing protein [Lasiosphaeria miniovina]|uniref:Ribosomal protein S30-domain-containing protein n=1 Tax=Lasiosphaeria miniovina TaxID=1954250 RepID=A0AA40AJS3_9PEZI|nr:ribosomal protein S30-domain-containing protein [Lasiosphaeria miniovina]KAK0717104.1 ribosomal protein S30-domain-containing protein [Lasiosphaeria miniovina]
MFPLKCGQVRNPEAIYDLDTGWNRLKSAYFPTTTTTPRISQRPPEIFDNGKGSRKFGSCRYASSRTYYRKVKSQTPKVEKQEKKKVPKGRAKKRLQYTRRFVNVTLVGGKRKMNPNPTA